MRPTRRQLLHLVAALAATVKRGMDAPPEVLQYFRAKDLRPGFSYQDVWGQEHAHAMTVAGVTETRVLSEFQAAIDTAIAKGTGFEKFRADMQTRLTPLGWWGPRELVDPEGRWKPKVVNFAAPARLQITFWSNMRAARAAGQWNRIQRTKRALPYLLYVRSASERKRPEHLRLVGTILLVDHPFWSTHFPPNGWSCKCSVRQLDQADRDDYLSRPKSDAEDAISYSDEAPDLGTRTFTNRRTGEVTEVPVGIDPGWDTNPGLSRARTLVRQLTDQLDTAGPERASRTIAKLWDDGADGRAIWPKAIAKMDERVHVPVAASERAAVEMEAQSPIVVVSSDTLARKVEKHTQVDVATFGRIQEMLDAGEWLAEGDTGTRVVLAEIDGLSYVVVLRRSVARYLRVQTLYRADRDRQERLRRRAAERAASREEE
ncbi:hypothetical protein CCR97_04150 [Rhodoplanes elegans]|uniref:Phage head morphogenesis domain-containing protein n=1 Tax=Rhodoplanes elegans TaxID=29408 RepID=A0A327KQB6_9BRAD|nr:phage minor head protein [Rhodoplanes elegans]MBK5957401.1 hypothetical protein [Rhodoplanes elegans]RAI39525.1 hypothetical protein CH338_09125 [Rhodoplanes elegans]